MRDRSGIVKKNVFLSLAVLLILASFAIAEDPVYFADPNLKAAVEIRLGINDPNASDMLNLTQLLANSRNINDLTGIEYAANLNYLELYDNQISDISPLSGLTNLTDLTIHFNSISDISPLSSLTSLNGLALSYNQISDIRPLSSLTNLYDLSLNNNQISDISPLSSLTNLWELYLSYNQISDISPFSGLTSLHDLILDNNPLNQFAYCIYIPMIEQNNPGIFLRYDPGECMLDLNCFNTRLEGTWYLRSLDTQKNGGADNFNYDTGVYELQANGVFTGTVSDINGSTWNASGLTILNEDGTISGLGFADGDAGHFGVNARRDVIVINTSAYNELALEILVREGSGYSDPNLFGTWYICELQTQQNGYDDNFAANWGTVDILSDGSFTCDWNDFDGQAWTDSGTVAIEPNGITTFTFDLGDPVVAAMNAGKDIMISNAQEPNNIVLDVLVKKGGSYSQDDMTGTWFSRNLDVPLNDQGTNDNFGFQSSVVTIQNNGSFLDIETYNTTRENHGGPKWSSGILTVDSNGIVTATGGDGNVTTLYLSAGKDVVVGVYKDPDDEFGLAISVKKGSLPGDLNRDGIVNYLDFAIFALHWLEEETITY